MIDIKKMTETELKALAFDEIQKIEIARANLAAINQELAGRMKGAKDDE